MKKMTPMQRLFFALTMIILNVITIALSKSSPLFILGISLIIFFLFSIKSIIKEIDKEDDSVKSKNNKKDSNVKPEPKKKSFVKKL
jgi:hypothetical protein